ncbi:unnamed protein product [Effrenium voratum]|nr:unnamed protein product [Effrenium voratum]
MFWSKATPEKDEKKEATEEGPSAISDITHSVLDTYLGATWRRRGFKHLTFRSEVFNLQSLDGLLQQPVDLTFLESLDVSENSLKELDCIAGTSARLKEFPQGVLIFGSLQVLKVRKNLLTGFMARLPMLRELDLGHNRLEDVPQGLGLLPKLEVLLLDHNQIGGTLAAVRKAQALKKLDLSSNQFDFRATQLYEQLENLEGMVSLALKLKETGLESAENPMRITAERLRKLDDISNMAQAREAAGRSELNLRALDELAYKNQELKVDHTTQAAKGPLAVFRPANKKTVFAELADFFARALNDPSPQIAVAGLTRLTHTISQCIPADMANLREELRKGPPAKKRIDAMIRDINLLMAKVKGPNQKILILRAVAKLSVIDEFEIGDNCMDALRGFAQKHPELEEKILGMLQEMIIGPLQETYMVVADPRDQRVFSFLRILSHFDSPKFGAALRNIANELSDMCCKLVKEVGGHYTEIGILMQKWSSCAENLQVEPVIGFGELLATILACLDLEMNAPDPSEDAKESSAMLGIALNMLRSNNPTAVKVFLVTSATKPAFYTRIMKMIMQVFGHSKKAPTVSALKNGANSKILAGLFDVMGALIALPGVDDLVEEIIHGHEYRGQLMKYMSCVLEDEMMSAPLAFAGALRLCWRLLIAYEPRKDWKGENVVTECITALHEMRILMELLSMKGESFDRLWKACSGGSEVNAKPVNLHEPEVIEIFEAIIKLVTFFSPLEGMLYAEVRRVVSASREELMFQMITVPHPSVKNAALECISAASISDYSSSEMESLISLLEVKPEELQASFMLLEKIMSQLNKMLLANTGQGALSLRTTHGNVAMEGVIRVFVRTSRSRPDTAELSKMRVELLQACLRFFRITETMAEWRQHRLRTKNASLAVITALQSEDQDALGLDIPDISAERTWTGRSVETLLLCLTGPERLKANSKVTFRVISRMADVLDGHSDFLERPRASSDPEMEKDAEKLHTRLMAEEAKPWDEEAMRKRLGFLDNMEEEDRRLQQEIFTSANGLERIDMFLGGLYPNHKARNTARLREVAAVQEGTRMIEQSTIGATKSEASEDHPESDSESETSQAGVRRPEAPVIELVARDFAGTRDLAGYDDLRQTFAGRLHSCVSILFTARRLRSTTGARSSTSAMGQRMTTSPSRTRGDSTPWSSRSTGLGSRIGSLRPGS